jgi:hypothetical protein
LGAKDNLLIKPLHLLTTSALRTKHADYKRAVALIFKPAVIGLSVTCEE